MEVNQVERWARLVFGAVVMLFAGIIYTWAILSVPFATEFGWDAAQLSFNYTLTIVSFCLGGFIAGLITNATTPRVRLLLAALMLFAGFTITSRLTGDNILMLFLAYGVISGCGVGFTYTTVIGLTNPWFPDKRGLCSGVLLMSFGLTTLVIGNVASSMMESAAIGWRQTFFILAIAEAVILIIASIVIKAPAPDTIFPAAKVSVTTSQSAQSAQSSQSAEPVQPVTDYSTLEMIRRPSFWLLFVFITFIASVGNSAVALARYVLVELQATQIPTLVGVLSLFNGFGRLVSGALYDNLGVNRTKLIASAVAIVAPASVVLAVTTGSLAIGCVGLALCYFTFGFAPTTGSVFASSFYGMKNFSLNFSVLNLVLVPAPFAAALGGAIYASTQNFVVPFMILVGCSCLGLILNLFIRKA